MNTGYPIDSDTLGNLRPQSDVVFSIGSNQGDSLQLLQDAVDRLAETPNLTIVAVSPVYRTVPVDAPAQPDFYNLVVLAETTLEPMTLLQRALAIEEAYGRVRTIPHGPRTLDIDLVKVGRRTSDTPELRLPHPEASRRAFVLAPWLDVEPDAQLPQGRVADILRGIDTSGLTLLPDVRISL
ncbi:MAG: 2-amino-4-hydroxy-6-hydroxymethyldihydropteridine diphosphokinase [Actinomycetia bacterium]|nr:2-amino-4-hydroxy-6-hydroxymethyldihydropteridine diphosphokinase [Actinomycetes bacterium]